MCLKKTSDQIRIFCKFLLIYLYRVCIIEIHQQEIAMTKFDFKKAVSTILKERFGPLLSREQVASLGLHISRSGKRQYTIGEIVDYIDDLQRISSTTLLSLFQDYEMTLLPHSYKDAILCRSPIYFPNTACKVGHRSIRTTNTRRCLICAEKVLREKRLQKAIRTIEKTGSDGINMQTFINQVQSMNASEKARLLDAYLGDELRAADFCIKANQARLISSSNSAISV